MGYKRGESETIHELKKRITTRVSESKGGRRLSLQFLQYYEEILYGKYPVKADMLAVILKERTDLLEELRTVRFPVYLYCKLIYRS